MQNNNLTTFTEFIKSSFSKNELVRVTIGKYRGTENNVDKIIIRPVQVKDEIVLSCTETFIKGKKDITQNFNIENAISFILNKLESGFLSSTVFTVSKDLKLEFNNKKEAKLYSQKPTFKTITNLQHNKKEFKFLDLSIDKYLYDLGLIDKNNLVIEKRRSKLIQIDNFIEVVKNAYDESSLQENTEIHIVDMGCGRGYLTFGIFNYFNNVLKIKTVVTGVDRNSDYVNECNNIAAKNNFESLNFVIGKTETYEAETLDIVIALHACDTATDDAMLLGINCNASLIITAPCCQRELRSKIKPPQSLKNIFRYPTIFEKEIEIFTDGIRSLFLESKSYEVKVFEFTTLEHTGRNIMIVANKNNSLTNSKDFELKIQQVKKEFSIEKLYLEKD